MSTDYENAPDGATMEDHDIEKKLRASEERYRSLISATSQIVWTTDSGGCISGDMTLWCAYTGQRAEEMVDAEKIIQVIHPDDRERVLRVWKQAITVRQPYATEFRLCRYDGVYRYFAVRGVPLFETDGRVREWVGVCSDINEQKLLEEHLHESERRFRIMFEQAAVGIAYVSIDGRWLQVNQKLCTILGYTYEELLEQTFQDITYPDDLEADLTQVNHLLSNELQTYTMEKRYFRKDGSLVWANLTVSLVRDTMGKPQYFISVIEDISERKRVEAQAAERAQQVLESNRRMEDFLGVASHELRTPLTTIKANVQLALRRLRSLDGNVNLTTEEVGEKVSVTQDMLRRAERQIGVLNRLVGDMIDISRIQSGKLHVHVRQEPANLITIVQEVVQEQRKAIPGRSILLEMPAVDMIPVLADSDRIGQVLNNYVSNALKYSEVKMPVVVQLKIESEGQFAHMSVYDEGPGLPYEEQQRIWQCFYQAPGIKVLSGSGVGLGLGLYISQTIIARHHGQVGVHSKLGEGSTFWFTLPIVEPADTTTENEA